MKQYLRNRVPICVSFELVVNIEFGYWLGVGSGDANGLNCESIMCVVAFIVLLIQYLTL